MRNINPDTQHAQTPLRAASQMSTLLQTFDNYQLSAQNLI